MLSVSDDWAKMISSMLWSGWFPELHLHRTRNESIPNILRWYGKFGRYILGVFFKLRCENTLLYLAEKLNLSNLKTSFHILAKGKISSYYLSTIHQKIVEKSQISKVFN